MRVKKDAQVSVEYMALIGFVTLITIPLVIIYSTYSQQSKESITSAQIHQVAKKIVDAAESVYYLGEPSQTTLKVNIPDDVVDVDLSYGYEVVFKVKSTSGISDIVQVSSVNITGSLPTNRSSYSIIVKALSDHVEVSYR